MGFEGKKKNTGGSGAVTIYTGDDTIVDSVRNVTVSGTLNFLNGDIGFGVPGSASAKVHIHSTSGQISGTIISTDNIDPTESILQVVDAGMIIRYDVRANGVHYMNERLIVGYNLGSVTSPGAVVIKGSDSSFLSTAFEITDGNDVSRWKIQNDGVGYHTAISSHIDSDFSAGYNIAYRYTGVMTNHVVAIDALLLAGTVPGSQTTTPLRGYVYGINSTTLAGAQGRGYFDNAAMGGDGVLGYVTGNNWGRASAVRGYLNMSGAGNSEAYAGLFEASMNDVTAAFPIFGVKGRAFRTTGVGGIFIGGDFGAENGDVNIALRVEANKGRVLFGASAYTMNDSLVEVTGDLEFIGNAFGPILNSPNGSRWRFVVSNAGVVSAVAA